MLTIEISRSFAGWNAETRHSYMNMGAWGINSPTYKIGKIDCPKYRPIGPMGTSGTWKPRAMNELSESFIKETYQAMDELDRVKVKKFDSIDELFDDLERD